MVMVAGNRPLETKTGPMYIFGEIESGNRHGAMVVSVVLLACSLGVLVVLNRLQRRGGERDPWRLRPLTTADARPAAAVTLAAAGTLGRRLLIGGGARLVRAPDPGADARPGPRGVRRRARPVLAGASPRPTPGGRSA